MGRNNRRDSDGNRRSATWLFLDCDTVYGGADHYWHSVCRCAWVLSSPISFETYFKRPLRYRCRLNRQGDLGLSELHETIRGGERVLIRQLRPEDMAVYPEFL